MSERTLGEIARLLLVTAFASGLLTATVYAVSHDINLAMQVTTGAFVLAITLLHLLDQDYLSMVRLTMARFVLGLSSSGLLSSLRGSPSWAIASLISALTGTSHWLANWWRRWMVYLCAGVAKLIVRRLPALASIVCLYMGKLDNQDANGTGY